MAITLTISTNRQIKTADGGSIGATCGFTVELTATPTAAPDEIQREIRTHYEIATYAMSDQLKRLAPAAGAPNGTPKPPPPATNGAPTGAATPPPPPAPTPKRNPPPAPAPSPAKAPTATCANPNGPAKAPAAPQRPIPRQPADQRNAMLAELDRQFAPRDPEPDDDLADDDSDNNPLCEEDDDDDPKTALELLGWARHQPGDATQELAQIGVHRGFPRLIKTWSPTMVHIALGIYRHTSKD